MADVEGGGEEGGGDRGARSEAGPGSVYQQFVVMEELLDKLKLLNYETGFCRQLGHKPFSRHYFALATNSGEQFFAFASISAWLLQCCKKKMDQPQEYDDPNATISTILDELRQLGYKPDFAPNRLKTGSGSHCLWVLDHLADEALKVKAFIWKRPIYPEEEADEENVVDDSAELNMNKVDEEMLMDDDYEEDEDQIMGVDDLQKLTRRVSRLDQGEGQMRREVILESHTDAAEWRLEVERVLPQLKVTIRADNKDWRVHVDEMHQHEENIKSSLVESTSQLNRLHDEIYKTLEKVSSREKYLNTQLDRYLDQFRTENNTLAETKEQYRQASGGVQRLTAKLADVTDELDRVKQEMEERGSSMTDGAPLVRMKQSMTRLREECQQMEIRTGVLQHVLLRTKLKEKNQSRTLANSTGEDDAFRGF